MEGFGEFIGWLVAAALTVLLVVFLGDKIGIWDICAVWDTSCDEVTWRPKEEPQPIARQNVPPDRVQPKQEKQERGSSLPKELLPQITIGPWTINRRDQPQARAQIFSDFIGRWTGKVIQSGEVKDEYSVTVMINPSVRVADLSGRGILKKAVLDSQGTVLAHE